MRAKQCHKPPMTGNGKFIPPIKMVILVMTGGWCKWHCCGHSNGISGDGELLLAGAVCKKTGADHRNILYDFHYVRNKPPSVAS